MCYSSISVLLSVLLATALAQPGVPRPCMFPAKFTTEVETSNYEHNEIDRGTIAYDGVNERLYEQTYSRGRDGAKDDYSETIVLYEDDVEYNIVHGPKITCTYGPIKGTRKFSPFGVPTDALFTRETTMGVYPNTFSVNGFGLRYAGVKPNTTFWSYIKVTKEGCMPVKTQLFAEAGAAPGHGPGDRDLDMSETRDFFNSVLGIEDPGVFVPPSGCTKRPPSPSPAPALA